MDLDTIQATASNPNVARSLTGRRWIWPAEHDRAGLAIAQLLDLPEIVGRLLAARGIDADASASFLAPTLRALLPDPSAMIDMDAAAERLAAAIRTGETVAVFGDYDVDGACSAALMTTVMRDLGCSVLTHIPDRMTEGYGPNANALRGLVQRGARLIICVDCGTAAHEALAALRGLADVLVLDHHKAEGPPPEIVATVNPNRLDCGSGLRFLCAAGVSFLAAVATVRLLRRDGFFAARKEPDLLALLDLVALATVCDVMPLTGLNRAFVTQGLKVMARRQRPGLAALLEVAQATERPNAITLGYALGPRINAGGRISTADLGLRLLLTTDEPEARRFAWMLDGVNRQRQTVEAAMLESAMLQAEAQAAAGRAVLMVSGPEWHPGVVGIVAGRIKERFNRPACVAALADGMAKGSGRSLVGLDLGAAVIAARQSGLLLTGGGHAMAAGFSLRADRMSTFHDWLDERLAAAATRPSAADLAVDGAVAIGGCTVELAQHLARLAPFGMGNDEPVVVVPRARVVRADRVGRELATVRAFLEPEGGGPRLKAVLFRAKEGALAQAMLSRDGPPLHLAGHLRPEEWNGTVSSALVVIDAMGA